jgi:hypothetical protein
LIDDPKHHANFHDFRQLIKPLGIRGKTGCPVSRKNV